ncbi:hypothetical protein [Jatrophihabitans fulvus]
MLVHWSFNANDPAHVAPILAEILGGEVVRPPVPPYGPESVWVCLFDEIGTLVELAPSNVAWVPDDVATAVEKVMDEDVSTYTYNHTLWKSAVSVERIREICEAEGWHTRFFDGPFKFQGVWIENRQYVEFAPAELLPLYTSMFGREGRDTMRAKNAARGELYQKIGTQASRVSEFSLEGDPLPQT